MSSLKISGVDKIFPSGSLALYDINLEAVDKEFLVILGGESSGKTTLLRIVAGLEEASDGTVFIDGKDMTDVVPKDRNIAMVFRSDTLYPALTVYDNIAFGLKLRKTPHAVIDRRVKAVAEVLGLTEVLYRKPKTISSVQRQRTAIGRAIAREPRLYLFDEPLSGLDDNLKSEMLDVIINLQARMQGTFVYSTKNVAEALTIGTRIAVLREGILQQVDTPANLYDYPANAYVSFLIGSPTINFINNAEIVEEDGALYATEGELKFALPENILSRFEQKADYVGTGKKVIVGIRPEDVTAGKEGIKVKVTKIDEDGFAVCDIDGHEITAKTEMTAAGEGKISVNCERLYLFDGETRLTLLSKDDGYEKTQFAEADYIPPTYPEEEEIKSKFKPEKTKKKKK